MYGEPTRARRPSATVPSSPSRSTAPASWRAKGLISAFAHNYGIQSSIFDSPRSAAGTALTARSSTSFESCGENPRELEVLGDRKQAKPNLHVSECVDGMIFGWQHSQDEVNYFNLGCEGATAVDDIARFVISALGLHDVRVTHTGGERGWKGDVPQVRLDCSKMKSLGWEARFPRTKRSSARVASWWRRSSDEEPRRRHSRDRQPVIFPNALSSELRRRRNRFAGVLIRARRRRRQHGGRPVRLHHRQSPVRRDAAAQLLEDRKSSIDSIVSRIRSSARRSAFAGFTRASKQRRSPTFHPGPAWARRAASPLDCCMRFTHTADVHRSAEDLAGEACHLELDVLESRSASRTNTPPRSEGCDATRSTVTIACPSIRSSAAKMPKPACSRA